MDSEAGELTLIRPGVALCPLDLYLLSAADVADLGFRTKEESGHPSLLGFNRCKKLSLSSLKSPNTWTLHKREGSHKISDELQAEASGILGYHTDLSHILSFYRRGTRSKSEVQGETEPTNEKENPKAPGHDDPAVSAASEGEEENQ